MKFYDTYLKPQTKSMVIGLICKALGAILELVLPFLTSNIIDEVIPTGDVQRIILNCLLMVICAIGAWRLNIFANRNASLVARNATEHIRHDLFEHILALSSHKTDEFTIPSLESRMTTDTYNVHRMISMVQRIGIRGPIIMIGGLFFTFSMEPVLSLVILATFPFIGFLVYFRATKGLPLFKHIQKVSDQMVAVVRENAQGIRVIKSLSKKDYEKNRFEQVNQKLEQETVEANRKMAIVNPGINLFLNLGLFGVILLGAYRISIGVSSTGKIIAFMSYFTIMSRAMMMIGRIFIMTSQGLASVQRIEEVLGTETEKDVHIGGYPNKENKHAIEFDDVTFSYLGIKNNLQHISFTLDQGQSLGIIGAIGSGKTTILSLLLRFYEINTGVIYLNGIDIRNLEFDELRQQFGTVMQNDTLFRASIKENIVFDREITDEDITKAIQTSQAKEFINQYEDGIEHNLTGKGSNLSGGQKQRVLLARALASHTPFLLLDDSSSALDYKTDALLRKALDEEYQDSTKMIIAERVSSIMNCNKIIVLDKGKIDAIGTHEELLENSPIYASIYASQMGGALYD